MDTTLDVTTQLTNVVGAVSSLQESQIAFESAMSEAKLRMGRKDRTAKPNSIEPNVACEI